MTKLKQGDVVIITTSGFNFTSSYIEGEEWTVVSHHIDDVILVEKNGNRALLWYNNPTKGSECRAKDEMSEIVIY